MKITKQRLQEIIKEEAGNLQKEGVLDFVKDLKGGKYKDGSEVSKDVQTTFDYFMRLINSPTEVQQFMTLLDDALKASTMDGKLGSKIGVEKAVVDFVKSIAPQVSVTVSQVDLGKPDSKTKSSGMGSSGTSA